VATNNHQSEQAPMDCANSSEYEPLLETLLHKEEDSNSAPDSVIKSSKKWCEQPSMKLVKPSQSDKEAICSKLDAQTLYSTSTSIDEP